jgi:hypothetical protein
MPEKKTIRQSQQDKRRGKAATTRAGAYVREEMEHVREGKHGSRSPRQTIAIGLSKARRAGVEVPAPQRGTASERTRQQASRDLSRGKSSAKSGSSAGRRSSAPGASSGRKMGAPARRG